MDVKSHFVGRYKKDLSAETFRAKIARRKSLTQKENRHKEFRKSRGLPLHDVNISPLKECDVSQLDEIEVIVPKQEETKEKPSKTSAIQLSKQRRDLLQRFKEEKQLRKLKEEREKAKKRVFKCGLYKPDVACFLPGPSYNIVEAKQKEKPAPPAVVRVTRSMAKDPVEQVFKTFTRSQNSKMFGKTTNQRHGGSAILSGRGPSSMTRKETDKENKVLPTAMHTRTTRATSGTMAKQMPKATAGNQTQRKAAPKDKPQKGDEGKAQNVQKLSHKPTDKILIQLNSEESMDDCKNLIQLQDSSVEMENVPVKNLPPSVNESKGSFAPPNFIFQPLNDLSSFKVQPMTPHRANAFLTPCFTWSPVKTEINPAEDTNLMMTEKFTSVCQVSPDEEKADPDSHELKMSGVSLSTPEKDCSAEAKANIEMSSSMPIVMCSDLPASGMISKPSIKENIMKSEELSHDVPYFRGVLCSETERLTSLCIQWDGKNELDIPEDAKSLIRTTVGQTRLLMSERFKQFEGLVNNCEFKRGEKETTCTDLDGFWDMISFQIEDVDKKFDNLVKLQENSWHYDIIQTEKVIKKKSVKMVTSKANQGDNGRVAARSRLAAIKAAMKHKKQREEMTETAAPEVLKEVEQVVFDAGFFRIESPAKPVPGSSFKTRFSASSQIVTPRSISKTPNPSSFVLGADTQAAKAENKNALQVLDEFQSSNRKVLFGNTVEESGATAGNEDCPMLEDTELAPADSEINVTPEKDFVPVENCRSNSTVSEKVEVCVKESPEETCHVVCGGTEFTADEAIQDIVMSSPEKTTQSSEILFPIPKEELGIFGEHETEILPAKLTSSAISSCETLHFFKYSTPPKLSEVGHEIQDTKASDLIVFSPFPTPN
ncbi:disks large-associated protein 5 [Rhinatrema bivittatum]|uniref:disks large-associated protein 5 n=1 Tax=Rhinatrema bivittatum TaxID=194408 RepID=UPI00112B6662|nr:disks large-associated protein 5 [Rhinatrema bivittatum]XP_029454126.1 disks large-associated protein 5 [Rhinatrema bivittatum]XP_029454127.1 disks large-associated protein 5 [Rhinatrema bivittatum]XP_029454128.1 disks large-associated protein 5 [Rhinatrema bivittatum]